jgi:hypothetical protein
MRIVPFLLTVLIILSLPATARAMDLDLRPVPLGQVEGLTDIVIVDGMPVVKAEAGDYQVVRLPDGKLALAPLPQANEDVRAAPPDIIPHASIVPGSRNIRAVWFAAPTGRYGHAVLGDGIEAAALKAETADGTLLSYWLEDETVFEDLTPRLADLNGDGEDEIIAVRSDPDRGAAVALFGVREGKLVRLAESDPIGLPNRWLNPIGAGDFDGDGKAEIAVIRTPHIGGILMLYRWQGERLEEIGRTSGFSNHAIGSTVLGMSAVLDIDGDGAREILVPDQSRTSLRAVSHAGGQFRTLWSVRNSVGIATSIVTARLDGHGGEDILYGLADGSVMLLRR